jgi:pyridoxamine 5'-phosphate oxidase
MKISVAHLRQNYTKAGLLESEAATDPFEQFHRWLSEAIAAGLNEPNAMTLATVTPDGKPDARIVLLKAFDQRGFSFFTNYDSAKGKQLNTSPWAALVFLWGDLERQVRIEGQVEPVSAQESDEYFQVRPWASQVGAWASHQSQAIASREVLEERFLKLKDEYPEGKVPRPPNWGGFRVIPRTIEFWQGRPSRLHDRLRYRSQEDGEWLRERLEP